MDGDNELNIIVSLQDDASSQLEAMVDTMTTQVDDLAETFEEMSSEVGGSVSGMQSEVSDQLNDMASDLNSLIGDFQALPEEVQESIMGVGGSFDAMASSIEQATTAAKAALDSLVNETSEDSGEIEASLEGVNGTLSTLSNSGGLMILGQQLGQAATAMNNGISTAVTAGDQWNQELAAVQQTLKDTGSSIPVSQVEAFAMQMSQTTPFTQQQALAAADLVLKYKDLQGGYQQIVEDGANAAVSLGQTTGSVGDLGNAVKTVSDAMENPANAASRLASVGVVMNASTQAAAKTDATSDPAAAKKDVQGAFSGIADDATSVYGAADATDKLKKSMNQLATTMGGNLITQTNAWLLVLKPIVDDIDNWAAKNPNLSGSIVLVADGMANITSKVAIFLAMLPLILSGLASIGVTMDIAMGPIGWIALAIGAIAVAADLVISHWNVIGPFFVKLWNDIKAPFVDFGNWIATAWNEMWNNVYSFLSKISQDIQNALQSAWDFIEQIFQKSGDAITTAWNALWTGLGDAVTAAWQAVEAVVKDSINSIITLINNVINSINSVMAKAAGVLHVSAPQIPDIPLLADGGIVNQATLAIIGEAGPEAVIPLSQLNSMGMAGGGQNQSGSNIVVNFNQPVVRNSNDIQALRQMIDKAVRPLLVNAKIAHN